MEFAKLTNFTKLESEWNDLEKVWIINYTHTQSRTPPGGKEESKTVSYMVKNASIDAGTKEAIYYVMELLKACEFDLFTYKSAEVSTVM